VRCETEAYRTWTVKPPLKSEFRHVKGDVECPYGRIEVEYIKEESGVVRMEVTVPTSTVGHLLLPRKESEVDVTRRQDEQSTIAEKGERIALKPGRYELVVRP
jgi:hypothetical protein